MYGALASLVGGVLSGPLALWLIQSTHPQPGWAGPAQFAGNYHPVQGLPFIAGFLLVGGWVVLIASLHAMAAERHKPLTTCALVSCSVFAAFIFFNYVVQTSFLPGLAGSYQDANASLVATFSMSNPRSLAWAIEMWGYGFLGVATWLVAPVFQGSRLERVAASAFVANGPASILPAVFTASWPGWVMTAPGLVAYGVWNALALAMATLALLALRRRARAAFALRQAGAAA
jgi:hypothetical protein